MNVTAELIEAVADSKGVDARELPPLNKSIDPDALETLWERDAASGVVIFEYADTRVRVFSEGMIILCDSISEELTENL